MWQHRCRWKLQICSQECSSAWGFQGWHHPWAGLALQPVIRVISMSPAAIRAKEPDRVCFETLHRRCALGWELKCGRRMLCTSSPVGQQGCPCSAPPCAAGVSPARAMPQPWASLLAQLDPNVLTRTLQS